MLTSKQTDELLRPVDGQRVKRDGKGYSHLEAWDVRRTMNHIFGFGEWCADVDVMELVREVETTTRQGKPAWYVVYRARCTLRVNGATYTEWAAGECTNPINGEAHDQAIKTAESQAFKRAAMNLGDQFGLSLYNSGSTEATVGNVLGEYADSGSVADMELAFGAADSMEDLARVAQEVAALDISEADVVRLRAAYQDAKQRLEASTAA